MNEPRWSRFGDSGVVGDAGGFCPTVISWIGRRDAAWDKMPIFVRKCILTLHATGDLQIFGTK